MVTSAQIKDGAVHSADIRDGGVYKTDLSDGLKSTLARRGADGADGAPGVDGKDGKDGAPGLSNLEADGPYPGATDLGSMTGQGDNSDATVKADGQRQSVWVECAPGKVALGGGFRLAADQTQQAAEAIQVLASEPTQIKDGQMTYEPIAGDEAGSLQPNGWVVEVVNHGDTDQVVRPWVVCATVAK
jgi:hypothetical protein